MTPGRIIALLPLLLPGCNCEDSRTAPVSVVLGTARQALALGVKVTAADRRGKLLAVGTDKGGVLLVRQGGGKEVLEPGVDGGHDGRVTVARLSADGGRLLTVGGHVVMLWDTRTRRPLRLLKGPQRVTAGALLPSGATAFFGTAQGHVLRWEAARPRAQAVQGFACGGTHIPPVRLKLPEQQRCRYGAYVKPESGPAVCVYPVTHIVLLRPGRLARACRTGDGAVMELKTRRLDFFTPGHLSTLTPLDPRGDLVLLGRADGKLRLFDLGSRKPVRSFEPSGRPDASAAWGDLFALAQGRHLRVWHRAWPRSLAQTRLPAPARWIAMERGKVTVLLEDGRMVSHALKVSPTAR